MSGFYPSNKILITVRLHTKIGSRGQMKRLKWFLALSVLVAVGCAVQVNEITKPARVNKVSDKDKIERYHVVVSKREGAEQVFLFMKVFPSSIKISVCR